MVRKRETSGLLLPCRSVGVTEALKGGEKVMGGGYNIPLKKFRLASHISGLWHGNELGCWRARVVFFICPFFLVHTVLTQCSQFPYASPTQVVRLEAVTYRHFLFIP